MKKIILIVVALALVFGASAVLAKPDPKGDPFTAIWEAIVALGDRIDNIVLLPGPQGEPGEPGADGKDGLNCWDLNGNGVCDLATEDRNGDLVCDALDCRGEKGEQGEPGWDEARIAALESRVANLENYFAAAPPTVIGYRLNGLAANAELDFNSPDPFVSISITASKPVYWYRVWICKKDASTCGSSLYDGATVQYWFRSVPPYVTEFVSDAGQWDGKDYQGIPVPDGEYMIRVYIADEEGQETRPILEPYTISIVNSPLPKLEATFGSYGSSEGQFNIPFGVAVDGVGNVYVTDRENHRIQKFDASGNHLLTWGTYGSGDGKFINADNIIVAGNYVYVSDWDNNYIQKFDLNGSFVKKWGTSGPGDGQFSRVYDMAVYGSFIYVADRLNHRVQKFDQDGNFIKKWGSFGSGAGQFDNPVGVATDAFGNVYIAEAHGNRVQKFSSEGAFIKQWGGIGSGNGQISDGFDLETDASGYIYLSDRNNSRIQKFDLDGNYVSQWPAYIPAGIAVYQNKIYIVEPNNNRVMLFKY